MNAKILIADDESDIVSMLGNFFESKGFRVLPAFNGAEALKQVEKQPDIILLDINMPGTDGLEVCKRIRDHISCPILFLTARIEDTDKVKGFAVGGDFGLGLYICKLLCEHHNGYLKIENTATGANVSAYFKSPAL